MQLGRHSCDEVSDEAWFNSGFRIIGWCSRVQEKDILLRYSMDTPVVDKSVKQFKNPH